VLAGVATLDATVANTEDESQRGPRVVATACAGFHKKIVLFFKKAT
jgi:hypothetical protein